MARLLTLQALICGQAIDPTAHIYRERERKSQFQKVMGSDSDFQTVGRIVCVCVCAEAARGEVDGLAEVGWAQDKTTLERQVWERGIWVVTNLLGGRFGYFLFFLSGGGERGVEGAGRGWGRIFC